MGRSECSDGKKREVPFVRWSSWKEVRLDPLGFCLQGRGECCGVVVCEERSEKIADCRVQDS